MFQQSIKKIMMDGMIMAILVLLNAFILIHGYIDNQQLYWWLILSIPLLIAAIYKTLPKKQANYVAPGMPPYFFGQQPGGNEFSKGQNPVYHDATNAGQVEIYATNINACKAGFERKCTPFYPAYTDEEDLRVTIGNHQCSQPYNSSILNIGATCCSGIVTTQALNEGAMLGGFACTGENEFSASHLNGRNLIWQIGPRYFGCCNENGNFNPDKFMENAMRPEVKMIELKLSLEAKYAGNDLEAAAGAIISFTRHTAFTNAESMLLFMESLRKLSSGKPVGLRLGIKSRKEFYHTCYSIQKTGITPDFITVDGVEDAMGFAGKPGMPLYEALTFVSGTLQTYGLKEHVKIIAAGKIISGFDILKAIALGADACCSTGNFAPTSRFTHAPETVGRDFTVGAAAPTTQRYKIFNVTDKKARVADLHKNILQETIELMQVCGFKKLNDISVPGFFRLMNTAKIKSGLEGYALNKLSKTKNTPILN